MPIFLTPVLIAPYLLLTLANRLIPRLRVAPATRGKVSLTAFLLVTSSAYFTSTAAMAEMLPPVVPLRLEIVYVTGVLQVLAAIGIWVPRLTRPTGFLLIGILPLNVYSAFAGVPFGGRGAGPLDLLFRIPFQAMVIVWTYLATGQRWWPRSLTPWRPTSRGERRLGIERREFARRHPFLPIQGRPTADRRQHVYRESTSTTTCVVAAGSAAMGAQGSGQQGATQLGAPQDADHELLRMMSDHHEGLVMMGADAMNRAQDDSVKSAAHMLHTKQQAGQDTIVAMVQQR